MILAEEGRHYKALEDIRTVEARCCAAMTASLYYVLAWTLDDGVNGPTTLFEDSAAGHCLQTLKLSVP